MLPKPMSTTRSYLLPVLILLMVALFVGLYGYQNVHSQRFHHIPAPLQMNAKKVVLREHNSQRPLLKNSSKSYVLSLSYFDEHTNGLYRLLSLQCWAGHLEHLNVSVVEPFVVGTKFGLEKMPSNKSTVRFEDLYDMDDWNSHVLAIKGGHHSPLVSWEEVMSTASSPIILAVLNYNFNKECNFKKFGYWVGFFERKGFHVNQKVCIRFDPAQPMSRKEFNLHLFPEGDHKNVTVIIVFDEWKGILNVIHEYKYVGLRDSKCVIRTGYDFLAKPSKAILGNATSYIDKYLPGLSYLTIMLRTELMARGDVNICVRNIKKAMASLRGSFKRPITHTFIMSDIGPFGSFSAKLPLKRRQLTSAILKAASGQMPQTIEQRQKYLAEEAGTSNGAFIALVEKSIASRGQCLMVCGEGFFQRHALDMYKIGHSRKDWCYVEITRSCKIKRLNYRHV